MEKHISKKLINHLTYQVLGAAMEVHRYLGPGLLEKIYEDALIYELRAKGLHIQSQQVIEVQYKELLLDCQLRYDLLVEDLIVVENVAVQEMQPVYSATLLSCMKHLKVPKGILLNFHVYNIFKEGQKTFVNEYFSALPAV